MSQRPEQPTGRPVDHPMVQNYLATARWFAGKGRAYTVTDVHRIARLPSSSPQAPAVTVDLVTVSYPTAGDAPATTECYQVPLSHYPTPQARIEHAHVGEHDDEDFGQVHSYDAVHDRAAMDVYLHAFATTTPGTTTEADGLTFHRLAGHDLDTEAHSTLFSGEQSNSSVAFGDDSLLKVFRKVTPGRNPDIEIHRALTEAANPNVAALYGWIEADAAGVPCAGEGSIDLAMLQQFLRTASDGWDLALTSVRNLFAEADLHADEVGGDFAGEAERLGVSVAQVHDVLARTFGATTTDTGAVAAQMRARLGAAVAQVPELAAYADAAAVVFSRLDSLGSTSVQRVHGDLHLGQTLRTSKGWKLVDFEGEPAKSLAERVLADSPWRDVAGMLRSLDYAALSAARDFEAEDGAADQVAFRAHEWAERNRSAFLSGYLHGRGSTETERVLIEAYEADKAVYEVCYEARNRPAWVGIPLTALDRLRTTLGTQEET